MSEPDPRLLERLFPGPKNSIQIQNRRNVSAAAAAPTGGSNKVRGEIFGFTIIVHFMILTHHSIMLVFFTIKSHDELQIDCSPTPRL